MDQLKSEGIDAEFLQLDIDNNADIRFAYEYIDNKYGKLDILVNNAGVQLESKEWGVNNTVTIDESALRATLDRMRSAFAAGDLLAVSGGSTEMHRQILDIAGHQTAARL